MLQFIVAIKNLHKTMYNYFGLRFYFVFDFFDVSDVNFRGK